MRLATPVALLLLITLLTPVSAQTDKDTGKAELDTPEAVLEAHLDATGGRAAWAAVQSRRETGERVMDGVMGQKMTSQFVTTTRYPGYMHQTQETQMQNGTMNTTVIQTPEAAWAQTPMGRHDFPVDSRPPIEGPKAELDLLSDPNATLTLTLGTYTDTPVYIVTVSREGEEDVRRWYDRESLLLVAAESANADGIALTELADYRDAGGLLVPFSQTAEVFITIVAGGSDSEPQTQKITTEVTLEAVEFNVDVDDALFSDT